MPNYIHVLALLPGQNQMRFPSRPILSKYNGNFDVTHQKDSMPGDMLHNY